MSDADQQAESAAVVVPTRDDSAAAYGFLANLFLNPRTLDVLAEYWLQNQLDPTLLQCVPAPRGTRPVDMARHVVERLYMGVDDVVIVGHGNVAFSSELHEPRYVHYLNFVAPSTQDFSLAIPVREFVKRRTQSLAASLLALYMTNEVVWAKATHAATMGEHVFAHFRAGAGETTLRWQRLYSPLAFALEYVCRLLTAMHESLSPTWLNADMGGMLFIRELIMHALCQPRSASVFAPTETAVLAALTSTAQVHLREKNFSGALRCLRYARAEMRRALCMLYYCMRRPLNRRFCLDDLERLPWRAVG